jgi:hypothetical protein
MKLAFGYGVGVPEDVKTAWGARLIAPNDLLHDRQDLVAENDEAKTELITWLNGETRGEGAIQKALDWLNEHHYSFPDGEEFTVFEDERGKIIGNTNKSGGYVYVAGWLKERDEAAEPWPAPEALREIRRSTPMGELHDALTVEAYAVTRVPIEAERWHTHYGWSKEEAKKFGTGSSEVRVFAVYGDGTRRELASESGRPGEFEFGYGGSGPHETARAIVGDREARGDRSPADLQALVPEVFDPSDRDSKTLVIRAAAVDERLHKGEPGRADSVELSDSEIAVIRDSLASKRDELNRQGCDTPNIESAIAKLDSLIAPNVGAMVLSVA